MLNLLLYALKLITKGRATKGYESMSEDRLLIALWTSEPIIKK